MSERATETATDDAGHRPRTEPQFEGARRPRRRRSRRDLRRTSRRQSRLYPTAGGRLPAEGRRLPPRTAPAESPTLRTWEVVEITLETVVGRDLETGDERTWDRDEIERKLAVGSYSTNLTDFEWISVYQVGSWDEYGPDADESDAGETPVDDPNADPRYTGRPYVSVVAYGDNGLEYGRWYRFVDPDSDELELRIEDRPRGGFSDDVAEMFDRRVREALEAEGYTVSETADGE